MNDRELIAMAAFRMRDVSKRLRTLAQHAQSHVLMLWLTTTADQVEDQARRAAAIVAIAGEGDTAGDHAFR